MNMSLENLNPQVFQKKALRTITPEEEDPNVVDEFDAREVFG